MGNGSGARGLTRLIKAAGYSWSGFKATFRYEEAFRQEVLALVVLTPLGIWLGENGVERALLVGSLLLVMIVELLNSGIEAAIDRIGSNPHELSGRAKDMGSAAVMLSIILVALVWGFVLFG